MNSRIQLVLLLIITALLVWNIHVTSENDKATLEVIQTKVNLIEKMVAKP